MASPCYQADGTVNPSRFVKMSGNFKVQQANVDDVLAGISQESTHDAPGLSGSGSDAASSGEPVMVYGETEQCLLETGDSITGGDYLKADSLGRGVKADAGEAYGAQALQSAAAAGARVRVQVRLGLPAS